MRKKFLYGKMIGALAVILALFTAVGVADGPVVIFSGDFAYTLKEGRAIVT